MRNQQSDVHHNDLFCSIVWHLESGTANPNSRKKYFKKIQLKPTFEQNYILFHCDYFLIETKEIYFIYNKNYNKTTSLDSHVLSFDRCVNHH